MQRTNTTTSTAFVLPPPSSAVFDFSTPNHIRITIPKDSVWGVSSHWHSPEKENCRLLHTESGEFQVSYHRQPRTGGLLLGAGDYEFKPEYWSAWSRKQNSSTDTIVTLVVENEAIERNVCSAMLDAEIFPYLASTPFWLRGISTALKLLPIARKWLLRKMCYMQLQVIYREHGHWEYHGGINALRWWQCTHPFDVGQNPDWTVSVKYRSQKLFSRLVQGYYHAMGTTMLGMRGDYPEYNPDLIRKTRIG